MKYKTETVTESVTKGRTMTMIKKTSQNVTKMMTVSDKDTRKDSAMTKRLKEIFEVTVKETDKVTIKMKETVKIIS